MDGEAAFLLDLVGGDRQVAREILADFQKSDAADRANLAAAVNSGDTSGVQTYAHRIKGAARAIGAQAYASEAANVELLAATGGDLGSALRALEAQSDAVSAWGGALA